jgi:hypothetical protein
VPPPKEPPREAFQAYALYTDAGWDQRAVARKLSTELGRPIHQGTVSRWVNRVKTWRGAGGERPALTPKMIPTDPMKLDGGPPGGNYAHRKPPE